MNQYAKAYDGQYVAISEGEGSVSILLYSAISEIRSLNNALDQINHIVAGPLKRIISASLPFPKQTV